MKNKRVFKTIISGSISLLAVVILFTSVARSQDLPDPIDFEKVVIDTSATKSITFYNTDNEYNLGVIMMLKDGTGPFSLDASYVNITIPPSDSGSIDVHFNPEEENSFSDALSIFYNLSPAGEVEVTGEGVTETVGTFNEIAPLLVLLNELSEDDLIKGKGSGKGAKKRFNNFIVMINKAYRNIEEGKTEGACQQLKVATTQLLSYLTGPGISELSEEIKATLDNLGCEKPNRYEKQHRPKTR